MVILWQSCRVFIDMQEDAMLYRQVHARIVYIIMHVGCCIDSVYGTSSLGSLYPYVCLYTLLLLLYMHRCCES